MTKFNIINENQQQQKNYSVFFFAFDLSFYASYKAMIAFAKQTLEKI
jgi:hypothetical protein